MNGKKVLMIDDEPDLVEVIKQRLELRGYEVLVASDGKEGLEKVITKQPDLILLDIKMPGIDGFEVLRRLRNNQETKDIPIIMFTVKGETRSILKAGDLGSTDYIIKPFSIKELEGLIGRYI